MTYDDAALLEIRDAYRADRRAFIQFLKLHKLELSIDALEEYAETIRHEGYAAQTVNKRITGAKKLLRAVFLQTEDSRDVLKAYEFDRRLGEIKKAKLNTKGVAGDKILTPRESSDLVSSEAVPERIRIIAKTLLVTGLRISELCSIRVGDVQTSGETHRVRIRGKGDKERWIPLAGALLAEIRRVFAGIEYLFETTTHTRYDRKNLGRAISQAGEAACLRHIYPHMLRHTFATRMIKAGYSVKAVSQFLGHSGTAITQDMYVQDSLELDTIMETMLEATKEASR